MIQTTNQHGLQDALFVAWQDQGTKKYFPVARLVRTKATTRYEFEFGYLNGAKEAIARGFAPFVAFPNFDSIYRSDELFPLFTNRLMPRSRPDFAAYVQRLDLDPFSADDMTILARSGGRRVTDSIELFPLPDLTRDGCYTTYFLAHGIRHLNKSSADKAINLALEEQLYLQYDFQNEADPYALSMRTADRVIVGYLPRYLLPDVHRLIQECPNQPEIRVAQINVPPAPIQQRLLCRMESCWPEKFTPFDTGDYQPYSSEACRSDQRSGI